MTKTSLLWVEKPLTIEAIQWSWNNIEEIKEFMNVWVSICKDNKLGIQTREWIMFAKEWDRIIKEIEWKYCPCDELVFYKTYDRK